MNQKNTADNLENVVHIIMNPERCFVLEQIERYLPGNGEKKFILNGLKGSPCYPNCLGYSSTCNEHPWNKYVTSSDAIQEDMRELSGIEIAISHGIIHQSFSLQPSELERLARIAANRGLRIKESHEVPLKDLDRLASMNLDPKLCAYQYETRLGLAFLEGYNPNGQSKCLNCDGHNQWNSKEGCYMERAIHAEKK